MKIFIVLFILPILLIGLMIGLIIGFNTANSTADLRMQVIEDDISYILKLLNSTDTKESDSEYTKESNTDGKV